MKMLEPDDGLYSGPQELALADWRRRIASIYQTLRLHGVGLDSWNYWRASRAGLYRTHPMSPLAAHFPLKGEPLDFFAYDPAFCFAVELQPLKGEVLLFDLGGDGRMSARPMANTLGLKAALGAELTLYWIEGYGGGLFLPFKDASCGQESYGGGRYLLDGIKGADLGMDKTGRLILDFNFAYNPSCSMDPRYVCPLSPPENHLKALVNAGEKRPR